MQNENDVSGVDTSDTTATVTMEKPKKPRKTKPRKPKPELIENPNKTWMKTRDVSQEFGIAEGTIYNWSMTGKLRTYKVGKCNRYHRDDVLAFAKLVDPKKDRD